MEAHGGRIWAESEGEGLGTRFTFTLPLAANLATVESVPPPDSIQRESQAQEPSRILVVDDDPHTLGNIRSVLTEAGYSPIVTGDPGEVAALIREHCPSLVLLDLVLPGTDGIGTMARIAEMDDLPVIFLSVSGRDRTIAEALEKGAADYLVNPFSPTELVARIRAALRKRAVPDSGGQLSSYRLGRLTIDFGERLVTVNDCPVRLTATEYKLLVELSVSAGRVLSHDHLLQQVWGLKDYDDSRLDRSFVKKLRRKLGDDARNPTYIFTEPLAGYRMAQAEQTPETKSRQPTHCLYRLQTAHILWLHRYAKRLVSEGHRKLAPMAIPHTLQLLRLRNQVCES